MEVGAASCWWVQRCAAIGDAKVKTGAGKRDSKYWRDNILKTKKIKYYETKLRK